MVNKENGGPAFPQTIDDMGTLGPITTGMSLRDYFAAAALTGILSSEAEDYEHQVEKDIHGKAIRSYQEVISDIAYKNADAMIAERLK